MTIQNICNWLVSRHANPSEDILTQMTTGLDNDRVAVDSVRERENVLIIKTKLSSRFSLCRGSTFAVSEAFQWNPQLAGARFSYTKRRLNRGAFGLTPGSLTWSPWFTSYFHRFICVQQFNGRQNFELLQRCLDCFCCLKVSNSFFLLPPTCCSIGVFMFI